MTQTDSMLDAPNIVRQTSAPMVLFSQKTQTPEPEKMGMLGWKEDRETDPLDGKREGQTDREIGQQTDPQFEGQIDSTTDQYDSM